MKSLLFDRPSAHRFKVFGYQEEGTTTTPLDMMILNGTDRFTLAREAIEAAIAGGNEAVAVDSVLVLSHMEYLIREHKEYIKKHGEDSAVVLAYPDDAGLRPVHNHFRP